LKQNETLVGTVGTISAQKSQHDVLEAAAALRDISGLYFVCVGEPYRAEDSEYFNKLARRRTELGLENSFFFADFTEDLADVYGSIDILAHAAKNEGLGRVILEAMAAGVPALARNESGPSEIVESGVDGLLFEPDNINDFVGKLKLIVTNRELRRNLSLEGKKKVSEKYTIEKSVSQIQNIYREISGN
jgi:glycosyltransferase involved in cell wall biosynthesis